MRLSRRHPQLCLLARSAEDATLFTGFYDLYAERVLVFFARRVLDGEVAMDLTSEVFARAYAARAQFRGTTEPEEQGWLFAIARNQLFEYRRRGRVGGEAMRSLAIDREGLTDLELERVEDLAAIGAIAARLEPAMRSLPVDQAEAVRLRTVEEHSYGEIADRLGVTQQVVRARVSRGLRTLAARLEGDAPAIAPESAEGVPR